MVKYSLFNFYATIRASQFQSNGILLVRHIHHHSNANATRNVSPQTPVPVPAAKIASHLMHQSIVSHQGYARLIGPQSLDLPRFRSLPQAIQHWR